MPADNLDQTLAERGTNYGDFFDHAATAQEINDSILRALGKNENYKHMSRRKQAVLLEGLHMIAHKIGRIVNGDPTYEDSFIDIEGYSKITRIRVCKGYVAPNSGLDGYTKVTGHK